MKFLLDTNVISEMMRPTPDRRVSDYLDRNARYGLAISAITSWEIQNGVRLLDPGRRRDDIRSRFDTLLTSLFRDRVLPWDQADAMACAEIMERKRRSGRPMDAHLPDAMIAATARCRDMILVTRNEREFDEVGLSVENPWRAV